MNRRIFLLPLLCALSGCSAPDKPSLTSEDPSLKIPAIRHAADVHDTGAIHQLVKDLDNDDPAVRFYAIEGLRKITGKHFDYRYYEDESQRKPAIERWKAWLKEQDESSAATRP